MALNDRIKLSSRDLAKWLKEIANKKECSILMEEESDALGKIRASQFEMLSELIKMDIDWSKVTVFHLDEYVGISENHPASFRLYLKIV